MNKKGMKLLVLSLLILMLCGCSLAKEESETGGKGKDLMIGVMVTEGHVSIPVTEEVTTLEDLAKTGRLYATIEKHGSEEPKEWEVSFDGIEGIMFIVPEFRYGEEKYDVLITVLGDDEVCDVNNHMNITDNSEKRELSGTIYAKMEKNKEYIYYMNPVYQTENGEIYLTQGNGMMLGEGDRNGGMGSQKLEESVTHTIDGETIEKSVSIDISFELMYAPETIKVYQMDMEHKILKTEEYVPGTLPEEVVLEKETVYVQVETTRMDLEGKKLIERELAMSDENGTIQIETFYEGNHGALRKQKTTFLY